MIHDIYLDTETTGLDAVNNDVIQLAAIVGNDTFEIKCQPYRWDTIQTRALEVHGYGISDLKDFMKPEHALKEFRVFLANIMTSPQDKFRMVAHNMPFDYRFVENWFQKGGSTSFPELFLPQDECICTMTLGKRASKAGLLPELTKHNLIAVSQYIGFNFDAHDALGDTLACKAWHEYLEGKGQETEPGQPSKEELEEEGHIPVEEEEEVEVDVVEPVRGVGGMKL